VAGKYFCSLPFYGFLSSVSVNAHHWLIQQLICVQEAHKNKPCYYYYYYYY